MTKKLENSGILVGAQNCHESENFGPFTGYINPSIVPVQLWVVRITVRIDGSGVHMYP